MAHVLPIDWLTSRLLQQKRRDDSSCLERDAFERGAGTVRFVEASESTCKQFAALPAGELEYILPSFGRELVGSIDIDDEVSSIARAPLEGWGGSKKRR